MNEPLTNIAKTTTPMSVRNAIGRESGGFVIAELLSMGVSMGVVAVLDQLIPKEVMCCASQAVAKTCIEPFQDTIEKGMRKFSKLEEFRVDTTKTKEQRAEEYAHAVMVFGAAWAISMGAKLAGRRQINNLVGIRDLEQHTSAEEGMGFMKKMLHNANLKNWSPEERMIMLADEGMHYGSIALMNANPLLAKKTDEQVNTMTNVLEKIGVPPKKAKELSSYFMIYELPNFLGMGAGMVAIAGKHAHNWPHEHKPQNYADIFNGKATTTHGISGV